MKHITITGKTISDTSYEVGEEPVQYAIVNPDRGVWNIYRADDYKPAKEAHDGMLEDLITDIRRGACVMLESDAWKLVNESLNKELSRVLVASTRTRKAAREYVEAIGGRW